MRVSYLKILCFFVHRKRKQLLSSLFLLLLVSSFIRAKLKCAPRPHHVPSHQSAASTCASVSDYQATNSSSSNSCKDMPTDPRPTLVFSSPVRLMSFVLGASAYMKDAFHMHNVRVSTIGGGSIASMVLTMNLSPMHVLAMGMHIRGYIFQRPLLYYFMREKMLLDWMVQELKLAGLTNRKIAQCCLDPHKTYFGVTTLGWWKGFLPYPEFNLLPFKATTPEEAMRYFTRPSCSVPVFRMPSALDNGKWAIDGSYSALYGIPEDADMDKVVRITPWPFLPGDVKCRQWHMMHVIDFLYPVGVRRQKMQFILGYNIAKCHRDLLVKKGLIPYAASIKRPCLETHLESFQEMSILRTNPRDSGLSSGSMDGSNGNYVHTHKMDHALGGFHAMERRAQSADNVWESWSVDSDEEYMLSAAEKQLFVVEENITGEGIEQI